MNINEATPVYADSGTTQGHDDDHPRVTDDHLGTVTGSQAVTPGSRTITCLCGVTRRQTRSDQRFCSNACKQRAYRQRNVNQLVPDASIELPNVLRAKAPRFKALRSIQGAARTLDGCATGLRVIPIDLNDIGAADALDLARWISESLREIRKLVRELERIGNSKGTAPCR